MAKNKGKNKGKNKPAELSKKERKALKAREAELLAKLERKAAKKAAASEVMTVATDESVAAVKAAKRAESSAKGKTEPELAVPGAGKAGSETHSPAAIIEAADKVLRDPNAAEGALKAASRAKSAALEAMSPADLKARVAAKATRRAELDSDEYRASVDRTDEAAVAAYNAESAELGLNHFLTGTAEAKRQAKRLKGKDVPASDNKVEAALHGPDDDLPAGVEDAIVEEVVSEGGDDSDVADAIEAEKVSRREQAAQQVETEHGREFAVGESVADETFANPSDAPRQLEEGAKGYKIIQLKNGTPDPRTVRQLTRVTTYIANLEDKSNLEAWKMRTLLEGLTLNETDPDRDGVIATLADLMHVRDVALAKAGKADRKGKLEPGERAQLENDATKAFKAAVNAIADDLLELGGVHEKANRGTNLHALTEVVDRGETLPDDESITPTDRASVAAYQAALEAAGIKVVEAEVVIVNDEVGYAGRLDRVVLYRPEGAQRAKRCIADIKTGRIDYGFTKIEQQVAMYADGKAYDLETGERSPIGGAAAGVDKHLGLLIHVPQGEGTAYVYELDLDRGRRGNKLSGLVREWRSESGKVDRAKHANVAAVSS